MRVTLRDVAQKADVSPATVSRVLNGRDSTLISSKTRQRVLKAARRLGYRPNLIARALVTGRTHSIAVWIPHLGYPFTSQIMTCVQRRMSESGYEVVAKGSEGDIPRQARHVSELGSLVDGVLIVDRPGLVDALLSAEPPPTIPIVACGAFRADEVDWVGVDLESGTRDALQHLLDAECRRIAFVVPDISDDPEDQRRIAYDDVMADAGVDPEYILTSSSDDWYASARKRISEYLSDEEPPDAFFCFNDVTAIGTYRALYEAGVRVPDDVLLVGCDGVAETAYFDPPISTIVQPVARMCELGTEYLLERIENPGLPVRREMLRARFVARGSSRAPDGFGEQGGDDV